MSPPIPAAFERFGNTEVFAIEAMIEPGLIRPTSPWGRICIWVGGVRFGDPGRTYCGLGPSFDALGWFLDHHQELWQEKFGAMKNLEVLNYFDWVLYGCVDGLPVEDDRSLEEISLETNRFWRYGIFTNWCESFDGSEKAFLVFTPGGSIRILSRAFTDTQDCANEVPLETFLEAIRESRKWYEGQVEALRNSGPENR